MLEYNTVELHIRNTCDRDRPGRTWLPFHLENGFEIIKGDLRLAVDVRHVPDFLERAEDEEGIDPAREELSNRDLARKDQVQYQSQNGCPQRVHAGSLDETKTSKVFHLLQLELQNLSGCIVEPFDFLLRQTEALHKFDVTERFGRGARQSGGFGDDHFLDLFNLPAEDRHQCAKNRNGQKINQCDEPVDSKCVHHHEQDAYKRDEENIDDRIGQALDIRSHFLELPQSFAAALVFEYAVRQLERMADAIGVDLCAKPLCDDVDVVILKILGDPRDERHAYSGRQQQTYTLKELACCVLAVAGRVIVNHMSKYHGIQERKDLVDRREDKDCDDSVTVLTKVGI